MKILIIGSKGFIGSACTAYFKNKPGFTVYGADVVVEYNDPDYFLIDGSNADFRELFKNHQFDWCINCAGAASVPDSFKSPLRDYLLNVHHLTLLLNAIKEENSACKFIQLSSAAVYGNPQILPIKEEHSLNPLSPYGIHKKQAEELCKMYHDYFGINTCVLRLFSAYGNGLKKQLFWDLYKRSSAQTDILLFGTGQETREFIHVNDIANAIDTIIHAFDSGFKIINVANGESVTIEKAAAVFCKHAGFKGEIKFNGLNREGDPLYWQADTTLLNSLGYNPRVNFEAGIAAYCKWLKEKE